MEARVATNAVDWATIVKEGNMPHEVAVDKVVVFRETITTKTSSERRPVQQRARQLAPQRLPRTKLAHLRRPMHTPC